METPEGCAQDRMQMPSTTPLPEMKLNFDLLTPPSSIDICKKSVRWSDEKARCSRASMGISSLPRDLDRKCHISVYCDNSHLRRPLTPSMPAITEETIVRDCLKRRSDSIDSPRKKLKLRCDAVTPKKWLNLVCPHQKENSPIKIESAGQDWYNRISILRPLLLKPPQPKFSNICCDSAPMCKDILSSLADVNMYHVIQMILGHLKPLDLVNVSNVSQPWKRICKILKSRELSKGQQLALTSKENICAERINEFSGKSQNETTPRKLYPLIMTNKIPSPKRRISSSPQLSPRSKRFCYYVQEGQRLDKTEQLSKCPKCSYPARFIKSLNCTQCSSCSYKFCGHCRYPPHPNKPCNVLSLSPSSKKNNQTCSVGSKASKKALRRL